MKIVSLILSLLLVQAIGTAQAMEPIVNGSWTLNNCGVKPVVPTIADSDVDVFNKSFAAINTWQQQAKIYFECLVKEANTDNTIIADTAIKEQAGYLTSMAAIGVAADAAKKKLDKK